MKKPSGASQKPGRVEELSSERLAPSSFVNEPSTFQFPCRSSSVACQSIHKTPEAGILSCGGTRRFAFCRVILQSPQVSRNHSASRVRQAWLRVSKSREGARGSQASRWLVGALLSLSLWRRRHPRVGIHRFWPRAKRTKPEPAEFAMVYVDPVALCFLGLLNSLCDPP